MASQLDWYLQINLKARQLRLLVAIADLGNLTKVAETIHVTLPAVSKALADIESGLGLELFRRTPQGLRATTYGECLIRYARKMLVDLQQARDELKYLSSGSAGKVNIGVYPASSSVLLPHALALLKQRSPSVNVLVTEGTNSTLLPKLWEGKLDLVAGRLPNVSASSGFESKVLLEEQWRVVTGPQHPLARREHLKWSALKDYPWVLPPVASIMREPLESVLWKNGIEVDKNFIETGSLQIIRAYLYLVDAIAVIANAAAHDRSQPLAVLPLSLPPVSRAVGVVWNRNQPLSPAAELLIACLEEAASVMQQAEGLEGAKLA